MSRKSWRKEVRAFYRRIGCRKRIYFLETCAECLGRVFKVSEFLISRSRAKTDISIQIYTEDSRAFTVVLYPVNGTWVFYELVVRVDRKASVEPRCNGVLGNYDNLRLLQDSQD